MNSSLTEGLQRSISLWKYLLDFLIIFNFVILINHIFVVLWSLKISNKQNEVTLHYRRKCGILEEYKRRDFLNLSNIRLIIRGINKFSCKSITAEINIWSHSSGSSCVNKPAPVHDVYVGNLTWYDTTWRDVIRPVII